MRRGRGRVASRTVKGPPAAPPTVSYRSPAVLLPSSRPGGPGLVRRVCCRRQPRQGERWLRDGAHGQRYQGELIVITGDAVRVQLAASAAAMDDRPFAARTHPHRDRLHCSLAGGSEIAGGLVRVPAQRVGGSTGTTGSGFGALCHTSAARRADCSGHSGTSGGHRPGASWNAFSVATESPVRVIMRRCACLHVTRSERNGAHPLTCPRARGKVPAVKPAPGGAPGKGEGERMGSPKPRRFSQRGRARSASWRD